MGNEKKRKYRDGSFDRRPNGTYRFRKSIFVNGKYKQISGQGKTQKEARNKWEENANEYKRTVEVDNKEQLLGDALFEYIDMIHKKPVSTDGKQKNKDKAITDSTYKRYMSTLNNQIMKYDIASYRYSNVTYKEIDKHITYLTDKEHLSSSTVKKVYNLLNAFYKYKHKKENIPNPVDRADNVVVSKSEDIEYLLFDEIQKFLTSCKKKYSTGNFRYRYGCVVGANIFLGLRSGELRVLKWKDVDLEEGTVRVVNTFVDAENPEYDNNNEELMKQMNISRYTMQEKNTTKTSKSRIVSMPKLAIKLLKMYKEQAKFVEDDDYILSTKNRKPISTKNLSDCIKYILADANIDKGCNTHMLRHTCASLCFHCGFPVSEIARQLGNSEEVCRERYVHFMEIYQVKTAKQYIKAINEIDIHI